MIKFSNLKRIDFKNRCLILRYRLKKKINIETSKGENEAYLYYCYLVQFNACLVEETSKYFISQFKEKVPQMIKLRKKPSSDFEVLYQVYTSKEYMPVVKKYTSCFPDMMNRSLNIIDGGSNIGLTSLFFTQCFNSAKILCVEPDFENFKVMDFNLKDTSQHKFVKINGAIWSSKTKIKVIKDFRDKSDWSCRVEETKDGNSIQAFSINDLMISNNLDYIDILKIDIEGSEKQVFTSSDSNLDFLNKTKCIALEIHDEFDCREDICSILRNYGFTYMDSGELVIGINQNLRN